jgi:hypothetical protein
MAARTRKALWNSQGFPENCSYTAISNKDDRDGQGSGEIEQGNQEAQGGQAQAAECIEPVDQIAGLFPALAA